MMEKIVAIDASEIASTMKHFGLEGLIATAKRGGACCALEQFMNKLTRIEGRADGGF